MPRFQPAELFRALHRHKVAYVLIGGLAAVLHGSPIRTGDADVCPDTSRKNLERLAAALRDVGACIRGPGGEALPFACDADFLGRVQLLNLTTDVGDVDVCFLPEGTGGYADLARGAVAVHIEGTPVSVASLADVIRSKEAAGRERDLQALPSLYALREEIEATDGE